MHIRSTSVGVKGCAEWDRRRRSRRVKLSRSNAAYYVRKCYSNNLIHNYFECANATQRSPGLWLYIYTRTPSASILLRRLCANKTRARADNLTQSHGTGPRDVSGGLRVCVCVFFKRSIHRSRAIGWSNWARQSPPYSDAAE